MELLTGIFAAAKENPTYGLFVFATIMWWLQWKRNEKRDEAFNHQQSKLIEALSSIREATNTNNTLLQALLTRRDP